MRKHVVHNEIPKQYIRLQDFIMYMIRSIHRYSDLTCRQAAVDEWTF